MLFRQMLRQHAFLVVGYFFLLAFNIFTAILFWPDLRENLTEIAKLAKFIPLEFAQDLVYLIEVHGYWAYFGVQQIFKGGGVVAMMAAALLGSLLIAREVDTRTAEFLFSRPISRVRLLLVRWATGLLLVVGPYVATTLLAWFGSRWVDESLAAHDVLLATLHLSLFISAVFSLSVALSCYAEHQLKPALIVIGIMLINLAIYLVKELWNFSLYKLIDLDVILPISGGDYPLWQSWVFVGVTVLSMAVAIRKIRIRDF
jgi:ABC-type transport system involved in multi-copper enzyme maturation permease subunit